MNHIIVKEMKDLLDTKIIISLVKKAGLIVLTILPDLTLSLLIPPLGKMIFQCLGQVLKELNPGLTSKII